MVLNQFVRRGARLISKRLKDRICEQQRDQQKELEVIKQKLDDIKKRTHTAGSDDSKDDWTHFEG